MRHLKRLESGLRPTIDPRYEAPSRTILIVCNRLFREALSELLDFPELVFTRGFDAIAEAIASMTEGAPGDLVIAVTDGEPGFTETLREVDAARHRFPTTRWLLLTDSVSPVRLRQAVAAGVDGVLPHDIAARVLKHAAGLLLLGQTLLPPSLSDFPRDVSTRVPSGPAPEGIGGARTDQLITLEQRQGAGAPQLSEREQEILSCLVKGYSNKVIARQLGIADATVKVHVKALLRKLRVANRTQAAILAVNEQMLPTEAPQVVDLPRIRPQRCAAPSSIMPAPLGLLPKSGPP